MPRQETKSNYPDVLDETWLQVEPSLYRLGKYDEVVETAVKVKRVERFCRKCTKVLPATRYFKCKKCYFKDDPDDQLQSDD